MIGEAGNQQPFNWNKIIRRTALLIALGVIGNIIFSLWNFDREAIAQLVSFSPVYFFIAILLALVPWVFHALEIIIWSDFFKKRLKFKEAFLISVVTDIGSAITPTMVGGAPIKAGLLMRNGIRSGYAAAMVTFTGIEDFLFFLILIPASLVFSKTWGLDFITSGIARQAVRLPMILLIIGMVILGLLLIRYLFQQLRKVQSGNKWLSYLFTAENRIKEGFGDFKSAMKMIAVNGKVHFLLAAFAISARWLCRFFILIALVKSLGGQADYVELFFSEWLVHIGMMLVPTPGAVGGAEGAFYFIFQPILPQETIRILTAGWRFLTYYLLLIIAVIYVYVAILSASRTSRQQS